eukprot:gene7693-10464_t
MSISFEDAVATLKSMFADWDEETLSAILISNNYHVEHAIETVLSMSGDVANSSSSVPQQSNNDNGNSENLLFMHDIPPAGLKESKPKATKKRQVSNNSRHRGLKCDLPDDFLRPPNWKQNNAAIADEQLALMLQNELFQKEVRELMGNEFMNMRQPSAVGNRGVPNGRINGAGSTPTNDQTDPQDLGILKALSSMGTAAKKNLTLLAERFNSGNTTTGHSTYGSSNNKPSEFQSLVNDNDDEDEDEVISFDNKSNTRGRHILDDDGSESANPLFSQYSNSNNLEVSGENYLRKKDK